MNILLTGTNNYLGSKLKSFFLKQDHKVTCLVNNGVHQSKGEEKHVNLSFIIGDLIRETYSKHFPNELDAAYYFSNYTSEQGGIYQNIEILSLQNYIKKLRRVHCPHLIYVVPLRSPVHLDIQELLKTSYIPYTIVRTSNIIGTDSALMKIFKRISSKLAIISNNRLAKSKCQPIALKDALEYLDFMAGNPLVFNQIFDIGGPDILSYQEMIEQYLKLNHIQRKIITLPFVHLSLSSYWLSKSGGIPPEMARAFNENIKGDILCEEDHIKELFPHHNLHFKEALQEALQEPPIS